MAITKNENGKITCTYPQLFADGEYWLDWKCLCASTDLPSTNMYRIIKALNDVPTYRYRNRIYYKTSWCMMFWTHVSNANR